MVNKIVAVIFFINLDYRPGAVRNDGSGGDRYGNLGIDLALPLAGNRRQGRPEKAHYRGYALVIHVRLSDPASVILDIHSALAPALDGTTRQHTRTIDVQREV